MKTKRNEELCSPPLTKQKRKAIKFLEVACPPKPDHSVKCSAILSQIIREPCILLSCKGGCFAPHDRRLGGLLPVIYPVRVRVRLSNVSVTSAHVRPSVRDGPSILACVRTCVRRHTCAKEIRTQIPSSTILNHKAMRKCDAALLGA